MNVCSLCISDHVILEATDSTLSGRLSSNLSRQFQATFKIEVLTNFSVEVHTVKMNRNTSTKNFNISSVVDLCKAKNNTFTVNVSVYWVSQQYQKNCLLYRNPNFDCSNEGKFIR